MAHDRELSQPAVEPAVPKPAHKRRSQAGQTLPMMMFFMVSLLGVAGLVIDVGGWYLQKRQVQAAADASALAGVSRGLPEWQRALKLQKRASRVGFDWRSPGPVLDKLHEELDEVRHELAAGASPARIADEIGDVLFVGVNLARLTGVDYSQALRGANAKFERRFRRMEALAAADGTALQEKSLAEQEAYWNRAKAEDKAGQL